MAEKDKTNGGWIKIYRSIQDNTIWNEKPFSKGQAWVDLLLLAKHRDEKFTDRYGRIISGKRGCIYMSEGSLSDRWGWSRRKVDNFLSQLESEKEIKMLEKSTTNGTTIFIVNYDKFQTSSTGKSTSRAPREHHVSTTRAHIQEYKEDIKKNKEVKEEVSSLSSDNEETMTDDTEWIDFSTMSDDEFEKWVKENGNI